ALTVTVVLALGVLSVAPVWGSIFGEENVTLVKILTEIIHANNVLEDMSDTASKAAGLTRDMLRSYQQVNAGIEEIRHYSTGAFLHDLQVDFYNQYPGFGELQDASQNLGRWATTRTTSPFTAYQAITAVVADASEPLRQDVRSGRANMDEEVILSSEAAGGFA